MKLSDLNTDLESVRKQLEEKYGVEVRSGLQLNPEDISTVLLTLALKTSKVEVSATETKTAVEPTEVIPAKAKRTRKTKEASSDNTQS